jgi:hypothetical protein
MSAREIVDTCCALVIVMKDAGARSEPKRVKADSRTDWPLHTFQTICLGPTLPKLVAALDSVTVSVDSPCA